MGSKLGEQGGIDLARGRFDSQAALVTLHRLFRSRAEVAVQGDVPVPTVLHAKRREVLLHLEHVLAGVAPGQQHGGRLRCLRGKRSDAIALDPADQGRDFGFPVPGKVRSEEHTSELQSQMRISYAVFCLKKKQKYVTQTTVRCNTRETQ